MAARRGRLVAVLAGVLVFSTLCKRTIDHRRQAPHAAWPTLVPPRVPVPAKRYAEELERKYGRKHYSYFNEEALIRDFFQDERNGYFVDVGASHYEKVSNTYYLEKSLGWRGIGVDAQDRYAADYARYRPNTKYLVYFVGARETSGKQVEFLVDLEDEYHSSGVDGSVVHPSKKLLVPSITLDELLERQDVTKVDFVSMDIEDGEPAALAGFSLQRWQPRLVCVEMHPMGERPIREYFSKNGYVQLVTYTFVDLLNGYFAPPDSPGAQRDAERLRSWQQELSP